MSKQEDGNVRKSAKTWGRRRAVLQAFCGCDCGHAVAGRAVKKDEFAPEFCRNVQYIVELVSATGDARNSLSFLAVCLKAEGHILWFLPSKVL